MGSPMRHIFGPTLSEAPSTGRAPAISGIRSNTDEGTSLEDFDRNKLRLERGESP
jgi:hypothetical protein